MTRRKAAVNVTGSKGRKFVLSSTDLVGEYIITDESDILDFTPYDSSDTSSIWRRITDVYGIAQDDVGSGRLVRIFRSIAERRNLQ